MAQEKNLQEGIDYEYLWDQNANQNILKGQIDPQILESYPDFSWFQEGMDAYEPDSTAMVTIKKYINDYDIILFLGTWCGDSHYYVPQIIKILQLAGYPEDKLSMYAVDKEKHTLNKESELYDIERVPTLIFSRRGNEKGRMVESVDGPIEDYMARFLDIESVTE